MKNKLFFLMFLFFCTLPIFSQNNIYGIIDRDIILNDNWAGQSMTLVKEDNDYYIYREIFGSGVSIIGTIKYNVIFNSDYKITFYEIISISDNLVEMYNKNETFEIHSSDNGIRIYLNGMELCIIGVM